MLKVNIELMVENGEYIIGIGVFLRGMIIDGRYFGIHVITNANVVISSHIGIITSTIFVEINRIRGQAVVSRGLAARRTIALGCSEAPEQILYRGVLFHSTMLCLKRNTFQTKSKH